MGEDTSVIREEIERTRERVGDEVDALSYKTDVGARVGDYVDDKKEAVKSKVTGAKDAAPVSPDRRSINRGASHMRDTAESNPVGLAVGGLAVGFLVGTLLPKTRVENEQMGEASDRLIDAAKDTAGEAVDQAGRPGGRGRRHRQGVGPGAGPGADLDLQERAQEQSPTSAA